MLAEASKALLRRVTHATSKGEQMLAETSKAQQRSVVHAKQKRLTDEHRRANASRDKQNPAKTCDTCQDKQKRLTDEQRRANASRGKKSPATVCKYTASQASRRSYAQDQVPEDKQ